MSDFVSSYAFLSLFSNGLKTSDCCASQQCKILLIQKEVWASWMISASAANSQHQHHEARTQRVVLKRWFAWHRKGVHLNQSVGPNVGVISITTANLSGKMPPYCRIILSPKTSGCAWSARFMRCTCGKYLDITVPSIKTLRSLTSAIFDSTPTLLWNSLEHRSHTRNREITSRLVFL